MKLIAVALTLFAVPVFAQVPLGLPQFSDPPESNGAPYSTYGRHILWNSGKLCVQKPTPTSWQCLVTQAQTDAAKADAVSQAGTNAAALYLPTATANASFSTVNSRLTSLESTTNAQAGQISAVTTTANAAASQASVTASVATLNSRIDTVQASVTPDTVCATTTVASAVVIPALGLSSVYTTTVAGAVAGAPCDVGTTFFLPLGGIARCIASAANTVQMRFEGALLTFPAGTYRQCVQIRP